MIKKFSYDCDISARTVNPLLPSSHIAPLETKFKSQLITPSFIKFKSTPFAYLKKKGEINQNTKQFICT